MIVYFTKCEYGVSYGGGLKEPFRHIDRIISDRFQSENIEFSFGEFEIQLASLPQNEKNEKAIIYYSKLPIYYRGKNMIRVIVPFSTEQEQNLTDLFQLIYNVFDIAASKKKKGDIFDAEKVKSVLLNLEKELEKADLRELNCKYENTLRQQAIEKRKQERTAREQTNTEKTKLIRDLRFYYHFENIPKLYFAPYDNRFCDKILEKLRQKKFKLPDYTHLYIMVCDTFENALYHAVRAEKWFVYGIAALENYADYANKKEIEKQQIVFNLIKQGLYDIGKIDKLDVKTLDEVFDEVERNIFKKQQKRLF